MKRKRNVRILTLRLTVMAAFIVVAAGTLPALASPQQALTFTVEEQFALDSGVFSSDGSIVCTSGTTTNSDFHANGFQSERGITFHDRKTITCNDGSGTFELSIQARTGFKVGDGGTAGSWVVLSGTGDYASLHGHGTLTGTYTADFLGIDEVYAGYVSLR